MTLWGYFPQQHWVPPYWIGSMHASISKNNSRYVQRTPFGRFTHLPRLSASFWSVKCPKKGDVSCYVAFLPLVVVCK